jgi:NNP family nitrate/nitrite transporter-like MFS transporter
MNNVITGTPKLPSTVWGIGKTLYLIVLGLVAASVGAYMLVILKINMWIVLPVVVILTLILMKFATPGEIKANLNDQFAIFGNKHTWVMTIIYTMTFGSFIGFSAAFPKLCQDIFVYTDPGNPGFINPNAPNFLMWVFLGPVIGALVRPVGGWLSDKINSGAKVTMFSTIAQIIATLAVAYFIIQAKNSVNPEVYWWPFFACFMVLFMTTGIGNGSTFRSISNIFSKHQAGPVLGWTSAIAAYGAFVIPKVFGEQIKLGTPQYALYGFAIYYFVCLVLNWWYYQGPKAEIRNP